MAVSSLLRTIYVVLTLCGCIQIGKSVVQFNFSTSTVTIGENGNLPSELSIVKTGENVMDISFRVMVNPGTARETSDYVANDNDPYVFTSTTRQLQIRTTLMTDRAGESVEQFTICLPEQTVFTSMGAEAVEPTCTTIKIIDDDSVVIGFADTSLTLMEGAPAQNVCAEVKDLRLGLDPFDRVPLNINANNGGTVQLSGSSILFEMGRRTACVDISAVDNNIADGNHSVSLVITSGGASSVPVELYPNILPVNITDNDLVTFTFVPQMLPVLEGSRNVSIKIRRSRDTTFAFSVMLSVVPLANSTSNDLRINQTVLLINPLTMESGFEIDISDNIPKMEREFNISLSQIEAINGTGALISKGEPIKITVFDKDFKVGFINEKISIPEGSGEVCVAILSLAEVHPSVNIRLSVTVENLTSVKGNLELETNMVVLNATNPRACIGVKFPNNNQQRNSDAIAYVLQLSLTTDSTSRYNVDIVQSNITITYGSQDSLTDNGAVVAAITVSVVFLSLIGLITIIVIMVIIISRRNKINRDKKTRDVYGDNGNQRNDDLPVIDHNIQETSSRNNVEAESTMMIKYPIVQANDQTRPMHMVEERVVSVSHDKEVHQSLIEEKREVSTETEAQQNPMVEKQVITDSELDPGTQQKPMAAEEGANNIQQNDSPMVEENLSYDDKQNPNIEENAPIDAKTTVELQLTNCTGDQMFDKPTNTETSSSRMQDPLPVKEDDDDVIQSKEQ